MTGKLSFSIADVMAVVLIVALDCTFYVRVKFPHFLVLPEVSVLLFGITRLGGRHSSRFFWRGFEVVGWIEVGATLLLYQCYLWYDSFDWILVPVHWIQDSGLMSIVGEIGCFVLVLAIYASPALILASIAGWLSARYQIVRRSPVVDRGSTVDVLARADPSAWADGDRRG